MPAAIAIPLIIGAASTAASVYAAKKGADASKKASDVQVAASNKAMDYQQQSQARALDFISQQQNRPLQPMGGAAFGQLSSRTGGGAYGGMMAPPSGSSPSYSMQPPKIGFGDASANGALGGGGYRSLIGPSMGGQPVAPMPGGMGASDAAAGATGPAIGTVKTFPNGVQGRWDGRGWEQI